MSKRIAKVSELLKQEISKLIKEEVPESYGIVTVTDVHVTGDFKDARVFISCFDKTCEDAVLKELLKKKLHFQQFLGRNLRMKFTPRLQYIFDRNQEKVDQIEKILKEIEKK